MITRWCKPWWCRPEAIVGDARNRAPVTVSLTSRVPAPPELLVFQKASVPVVPLAVPKPA